MSMMKRIAHRAKGFKEAADWDIRQQITMSPQERLRAARALKRRIYPVNPDIRACHRVIDRKIG